MVNIFKKGKFALLALTEKLKGSGRLMSSSGTSWTRLWIVSEIDIDCAFWEI